MIHQADQKYALNKFDKEWTRTVPLNMRQLVEFVQTPRTIDARQATLAMVLAMTFDQR
jgi:hypothetical protein